MATPPLPPPSGGLPGGPPFPSQGQNPFPPYTPSGPSQPSQGLPGPGAPQLSFFTLRAEQSRGHRPNVPPPQITVSISTEVNISHALNTIPSPRPFPNINTTTTLIPAFNTQVRHSGQALPQALPQTLPQAQWHGQGNRPLTVLPAPTINAFATRGHYRGSSGGRGRGQNHREMLGSGPGFGGGSGHGQVHGQVPGHVPGHGRTPSGFTAPSVSYNTSGSSPAFGSSPSSGPILGPSTRPGFVPRPPQPFPNRALLNMRGRGPGFTRGGAGSGGFGRGGFQQTFTPHTPSPVRAGNVNLPSFIAQTSSPLGPRSGSSGDSSQISGYVQSPNTPTPMGTGQRTGAGTGATASTGSKKMTATSVPFQPQPLGLTASGSSIASKKDHMPTPTKDGSDTNMNAPTKNKTAAGTETEAEETIDTVDTKPATLDLPIATYLLNFSTSPTTASASSLPTLSISVALYSPLGSFLPPLQPLILTGNTSLKGLILKLQEHLLTNLRHSGSLARLLVQSIEVRVFDLDLEVGGVQGLEGLEKGQTLTLPRIEGRLSGEAEEGGTVVVVGKTKWIAWDASGGQGESERFWGALVRKLLVDVLRKGDRELEAGWKAPMLKVRTVVKVGGVGDGEMVMGERVEGGGHLFRVPAGAILPAAAVVAEDIITPRGSVAAQGGQGPDKGKCKVEAKDDKGKAKENKGKKDKRDTDTQNKAKANTQRHRRGASKSAEKSLASTSTSDSSLQTALNRKFHKHHKATQRSQAQHQSLMAPAADEDKMALAEALFEQLHIADKAKEMEEEMKKKYKVESGASQTGKNREKDYYARLIGAGASQQVWIQKGGYPKDAPFDPENNWGKFAAWGEKPTDPDYENRKALHEAFPLSHIPFNGPPCKPWPKNDKQIDVDGDDDESEKKAKSKMKMVPFAVLDTEEFKQKLIEDRNKPENMPAHIKKYWEEQERIKGMGEEDDDTFFPAANPNFIKRQQAGEVFAVKGFKNPARHKNLDIISKLQGPTQRRSVSNSAYLNSLAVDGPSSMYDSMPTASPSQFGSGMTFNPSQGADDNTFNSSLQDTSSFSALAKQNVKSTAPGAGFYELSKAILEHTPAKEPDSFISDLQDENTQEESGEIDQQQVQGALFGQFDSMAQGYGGAQTAGGYNGFSGMTNEQHGDGYNMMGGNMMQHNMMSGENTMGGTAMGSNMMENSMMSGNMMEGNTMGGNNNQTPPSYNSFGTTAGGPSDLRGMITHGYLAPPNLPSSGWTSMNTGGATYNTSGGQSSSFNSGTRPTGYNHGAGNFPQYGQSGLPTPTPQGRMQSRFFNPMDNPQPTPGNEQYAFTNMAVPHHTTHSAAGSFANPITTAVNPSHPTQGSYVHGSARSRTHGLHLSSNPTAASRARRTAAIPIVAPPGHASVPGFQLPSPTRQAIGYGAGVGSSAPSRMNTPGRVRGTQSPDKKAKDELSAAIANAFNGPKGSPAGGNNA
ncbi:hypothetical protein BKA64DRAFT_777293 [Cadophora sp. MPI-SDFR-AT-0126]|nr:hypothetical protein BKA64DRAFT_777293 [Leotiomycetes sp. MPI-SDFR-AT-0126]